MLDGKLTIERFLDFQSELQKEILSLEFHRKEPSESGHISEKQFAELLLTYADYTVKKRAVVLKRVKKRYGSPAAASEEGDEDNADTNLRGQRQEEGISLEDYIKIFSILVHIDDLDKVSASNKKQN